jgi:hypothetical protein
MIEWDTAPWNIYSGYWTNKTGGPDQLSLTPPIRQSFPSPPIDFDNSFESSALSLIAVSYDDTGASRALINQYNLSCVPWRATYTLHNKYENYIQNLTVSTNPLGPLVDLYQLEDKHPGVVVPDLFVMVAPFTGSDLITWVPNRDPVNWSSNALAWYRDLNLMSLIGTMTSTIAGAYSTNTWTELNLDPSTFTTIPQFGDAMWNFQAGWYDSTRTLQHNPSEALLSDPNEITSQGKMSLKINNLRSNKGD